MFLALSFIIEVDDIDAGLKEFSRHVAHEYQNTLESNALSLSVMDTNPFHSPTLGQWANEDLDTAVSKRAAEQLFIGCSQPSVNDFEESASSEAYTQSVPTSHSLIETDEELRVMQAYGDAGNDRRLAAEFLDMDYKELCAIIHRVQQRRRRQTA